MPLRGATGGLEALARCTSLVEITIFQAEQAIDMAWFAGLPQLETLNIEDCETLNVKTFVAGPGLKTLKLTHTPTLVLKGVKERNPDVNISAK